MGGSLRWLVLVALAGLTGVASISHVAAHEDDVLGEGRYEIIVGFLIEPAFVGEKNALQLYVAKLPSMVTPEPGDASPTAEDEVFDRPVEGLESTLKAEVIFGDQRLALALEPLYGAPGEYVSYFFPMAAGDYAFRIFGSVEDLAIDETYSSSAGGFSAVLPRIEFPTGVAAEADMTDQLVGPAALVLAGLAVGSVAFTRRQRSM